MQRGHCSGRSYVRHKPIGTFHEDGKELPKTGIVFPAASCGRFTQWARHHGRRAHSHVRPLRLAGSPLRARSQLLTRPSKKTAEVHLGFWTLQPPCVRGTSISWTAADLARPAVGMMGIPPTFRKTLDDLFGSRGEHLK